MIVQLKVVLYEGMGKTSVQHCFILFLKILTEGAVMPKAGSLFQNLLRLVEKAASILR